MIRVAVVVISLVVSTQAWSADQIIIAQVDGDAEVLHTPSQQVHQKGPQVFYEGKYYLYQKAKAGSAINDNHVIRTGPDAKVRLLFNNGDQFMVSSGTSYAFAGSQISIKYGGVRAIVSKKGPRNQLSVRAKKATLSVRGTDFVTAVRGSPETVSVAVIRGSVEAALAGGAKKLLAAGSFAEIKKKINQKKLTQIRLRTISDESHFNSSSEAPPALEQKARRSILSDVKETQPDAYVALESSGAVSTELDSQYLFLMMQMAPE
jgi:hypothetical protein